MGASLGLAIGLPAAQALAIFVALGVGHGACPTSPPSWLPAVARWLPRPGAWMDTFRRLMAFPMFATVAWLVWVLGQQSGIDGAGALLALLVALSMVVWALTLRGRARVALGARSRLARAGLRGLAGRGDHAAGASADAGAAQDGAGSPGRPSACSSSSAAGKPVFVDFTAAWCVTCQYNKKTTLSRREVLADFDAKHVALLRADWTRRDPAITAALAQLGRSGVPVYVVYRPGKPPVVLSEVLGRRRSAQRARPVGRCTRPVYTGAMSTIHELRRILGTCRTLAVVGLSPQWHRPSFFAAKYMQEHGYRIVPINPAAHGDPGRAQLSQRHCRGASARASAIDMVDCFRRSERHPAASPTRRSRSAPSACGCRSASINEAAAAQGARGRARRGDGPLREDRARAPVRRPELGRRRTPG